MATTTETFDAYEAIGNREDLSDVIYNISPMETPFMMSASRGTSRGKKTEWQTDELAAVALNAVPEGDEPSIAATTATARLHNYTQISVKTLAISGTQEVVDKAGRRSELAYQLAKNARELKRDMEANLLGITDGTGPQAIEVGTGTGAAGGDARQLGCVENWLLTNVDSGTGYVAAASSGGQLTDAGAVVDGSPVRALLESQLKAVIRDCWNEGGNPTMICVGPFNKQVISAFVGNATRFDQSEDKRLVTAVDVYVSDFGEHRVVPDRFQRDRTVFVLTPDLWEVSYLRSFSQFPLARIGDVERRELLVEYTLCAKNEKGSGKIADVTTS